MGTAGAMFDFSCAAGLEPIVSSFSRRVFSWEMILRVAMVVVAVSLWGEGGMVKGRWSRQRDGVLVLDAMQQWLNNEQSCC